mgnify:CR=1 FL=1
MTVQYFAYGSNLASHRLLERLPNAIIDGVAILHQHRLCFRKNDRGQSGKCDIQFTGLRTDIVYGVIYRITRAEKRTLDSYETQGFGYLDKTVEVTRLSGDLVEAITYFAVDIDEMQQPYHWYKEHVLRGAREHAFPTEYIDWIETQESIQDADLDRTARELSIYA